MIDFNFYSYSHWHHLLILIIRCNTSGWIIFLIILIVVFYVLPKKLVVILRKNILSIFIWGREIILHLLFFNYLSSMIKLLIILSKIGIDLFQKVRIWLKFHTFLFLVLIIWFLIEILNSNFRLIFIWVLLIVCKVFYRIDTIQSTCCDNNLILSIIFKLLFLIL